MQYLGVLSERFEVDEFEEVAVEEGTPVAVDECPVADDKADLRRELEALSVDAIDSRHQAADGSATNWGWASGARGWSRAGGDNGSRW